MAGWADCGAGGRNGSTLTWADLAGVGARESRRMRRLSCACWSAAWALRHIRLGGGNPGQWRLATFAATRGP